MQCVTCGRELNERREGKEWRFCTFCKKPVCFDDLHYLGVWKRGLYRDYVEVVPVCKSCLPKKRRSPRT